MNDLDFGALLDLWERDRLIKSVKGIAHHKRLSGSPVQYASVLFARQLTCLEDLSLLELDALKRQLMKEPSK